MTLKATIDGESFKTLDPAVQDLYTESDGTYALQVDGMRPSSDVNEFRTNNINLKQQNEVLSEKLASFDGIDPTKFKEMSAQLTEAGDQKLLNEGKIDELVETQTNRRVETLNREYDNKLTALGSAKETAEKEKSDLINELSAIKVNAALTDAALKIGIQTSAIPDFLARGREIFKYSDNKITAVDSSGNIKYDKDGKDELGIDEWSGSLFEEAPHFFKSSSGGGANGGSQGRLNQVDASDQKAINNNWQEIASGKVTINPQ